MGNFLSLENSEAIVVLLTGLISIVFVFQGKGRFEEMEKDGVMAVARAHSTFTD